MRVARAVFHYTVTHPIDGHQATMLQAYDLNAPKERPRFYIFDMQLLANGWLVIKPHAQFLSGSKTAPALTLPLGVSPAQIREVHFDDEPAP